MAFEFLYAKKDDVSAEQLHQGDILFRDDYLANTIGEAHRYYADAPDYTHFVVLTQSCDLVRRYGKCKSRYITIAAARPASTVITRLVDRYRYQDFDFPVSVCDKQREQLVQNVVENLLHNTSDGFFFIPRDSHPAITQNLCVFLPLSISLRIEHYDACLRSKIAQLSPVFQAKLGSLAGHQYSRVGTPDLEECDDDPDATKEQFFQELLYRRTAWLSSAQLKHLKREFRDWQNANPGKTADQAVARGLLESLPKHVDIVASRIVQQLQQSALLSVGDLERAKLVLRNDSVLRKLVEPDSTRK